MEEVVRAKGHEHVSADHRSTFEVTTDEFLTPAGDCIVGIEAERGPADFGNEFVDACRRHDARIVVTLETPTYTEVIQGRGHPGLTFESERSLVGRTSDYVDDRTVLVGADRAAGDLPRGLAEELAEGVTLECLLAVR